MAIMEEPKTLDVVQLLELVKDQVNISFVLENFSTELDQLKDLGPYLLALKDMGISEESLLQPQKERILENHQSFTHTFGLNVDNDTIVADRETPLFKVEYVVGNCASPVVLRTYGLKYAMGMITREELADQVAKQLVRTLGNIARSLMKMAASRVLRDARKGKIALEFVQHILYDAVTSSDNQYIYFNINNPAEMRWMIDNVYGWWRHLPNIDGSYRGQIYRHYKEEIPEEGCREIEESFKQEILAELKSVKTYLDYSIVGQKWSGFKDYYPGLDYTDDEWVSEVNRVMALSLDKFKVTASSYNMYGVAKEFPPVSWTNGGTIYDFGVPTEMLELKPLYHYSSYGNLIGLQPGDTIWINQPDYIKWYSRKNFTSEVQKWVDALERSNFGTKIVVAYPVPPKADAVAKVEEHKRQFAEIFSAVKKHWAVLSDKPFNEKAFNEIVNNISYEVQNLDLERENVTVAIVTTQ